MLIFLEENVIFVWRLIQWRRQGGDWGPPSPVVSKTNFDIFLNLLRKLGGGGRGPGMLPLQTTELFLVRINCSQKSV